MGTFRLTRETFYLTRAQLRARLSDLPQELDLPVMQLMIVPPIVRALSFLELSEYDAPEKIASVIWEALRQIQDDWMCEQTALKVFRYGEALIAAILYESYSLLYFLTCMELGNLYKGKVPFPAATAA